MLSRISNLGGGKFRVENAISKFLIWGGGKFGAENAISNVENLGSKMLSRISNLGFGKFGVENAISKLQFGEGVENLGRKCYLESRIWVVENLGWKMLSISNLGGGKFGAENAISNLQFGWVENLGWKMLSRMWKIWGGKCYLESRIWGLEN